MIHFNSPKKINSDNRDIDFFRNLHLTFLQYDGNLLRRELYNCKETEQEEQDQETVQATPDPCHSFRASGRTLYRSHLYFLPHSPVSNSSTGERRYLGILVTECFPAGLGETTLVTQLSIDRLHMLVPLLDHWSGPVSLALYLTDPQVPGLLICYFSTSNPRLKILWTSTTLTQASPQDAM